MRWVLESKSLDETNNKEFELLVKQHLTDEKCLGIFRTEDPRDDGLPQPYSLTVQSAGTELISHASIFLIWMNMKKVYC